VEVEMASTSHYTYSPLPLPPSANSKYFSELGRKVDGYNPEDVTPEQLAEIVDMLYKVCSSGTMGVELICADGSTPYYCSRIST
jgi:hypothetical protein